MYTNSSLPLVTKCTDYHVAAADYYEEAARAHRRAAALYIYGD